MATSSIVSPRFGQRRVDVAQGGEDRVPAGLDRAPAGLGADAGGEPQAAVARAGAAGVVVGELMQGGEEPLDRDGGRRDRGGDAGQPGGELGAQRLAVRVVAEERRRRGHRRAGRPGDALVGPARPQPVHALQQVGERGHAQGEAEALRGGVLQVVALVGDQRVGGGQDAAARGHVAEQQRMVGDHDVRRLGAAAGAQQEAAAVAHVGAGGRGEAILALGAEVGPGRLLVLPHVQLRSVAGLRAAQPDDQPGQQPVGRRAGLGGDSAAPARRDRPGGRVPGPSRRRQR